MRESKTGIRIEDLKGHDLYGVLLRAQTEAAPLPDGVIEQKLFAAEDFYERDLNIRFGLARVFSAPEQRLGHQDPLLRVPADYDPLRDISEPAYDYPVGLWDGDRWALMQLRRRPVKKIDQIIFTWAGAQRVWRVPAEWIGLDRQFGTVQITPVTGPAVIMSFSHYLMTVIAGGRGLPHAILIDYRTGYTPEELAMHHQDLLEGVRLRTLLGLFGLLGTVVMPQGEAGVGLGLDGLSRSRSFGGRFGPYSARIELALAQEQEIREMWRGRQHGMVMEFL